MFCQEFSFMKCNFQNCHSKCFKIAAKLKNNMSAAIKKLQFLGKLLPTKTKSYTIVQYSCVLWVVQDSQSQPAEIETGLSELQNCFRHFWIFGVSPKRHQKDPLGAKTTKILLLVVVSHSFHTFRLIISKI